MSKINRTIAGDLRDVLPKPRWGYRWAIVKLYVHTPQGGHKRGMSVRPLEGQGLATYWNVESAGEMKDGDYPAGTLFALEIKEWSLKTHHYSNHRERFYVVDAKQAAGFLDQG